MLIKPSRPWNLPESQVTPEGIYLKRRELLKAMGLVLQALQLLALSPMLRWQQ